MIGIVNIKAGDAGSVEFDAGYIRDGFPVKKKVPANEFQKEFQKLLNFYVETEDFIIREKKVRWEEIEGYKGWKITFNAHFVVMMNSPPFMVPEDLTKIFEDEGFNVYKMSPFEEANSNFED